MPVALTLRLSEETAAPVLALADRFGPRPDYPPHVTLAILQGDETESVAVAAAARLATGWSAQPLSLAGLGLFPGPPAVLFLLPVVTPLLLARHGELLALLPEAALHPHSRSDAWVPHVTLAADLVDPAAAFGRLGALPLPLPALLDRLEVIRFPPARILATRTLRG